MRRGILVVVSAPSGGGKSTLVAAALAADRALELSVSCTTRAPRPNEVDGRDYNFISKDEFTRRRDAADFAEWAEVFDNCYATPRQPLEQAIASGRDMLLDVDIQGARSIRAAFPDDAVGVFVVPPSLAELETRLRRRGTDSDAQIRRRLDRARDEIAAAQSLSVYDYRIVNQDRDLATRELLAIITAERCRASRLPDLDVS